MSAPPPVVILDWDFDTFAFDGERVIFYDLEYSHGIAADPPELLIEGWPFPGMRLEPTLAQRIEPGVYRLAKALPKQS